jgi:hypothetical protein
MKKLLVVTLLLGAFAFGVMKWMGNSNAPEEVA